jgi:hypothetical protein
MTRIAIILISALLALKLGVSAPNPPQWGWHGADLTLLYNRIIEERSRDTTFVEDLRKTETAWLNFRDAHANLEPWIEGKTILPCSQPNRISGSSLRITRSRW